MKSEPPPNLLSLSPSQPYNQLCKGKKGDRAKLGITAEFLMIRERSKSIIVDTCSNSSLFCCYLRRFAARSLFCLLLALTSFFIWFVSSVIELMSFVNFLIYSSFFSLIANQFSNSRLNHYSQASSCTILESCWSFLFCSLALALRTQSSFQILTMCSQQAFKKSCSCSFNLSIKASSNVSSKFLIFIWVSTVESMFYSKRGRNAASPPCFQTIAFTSSIKFSKSIALKALS